MATEEKRLELQAREVLAKVLHKRKDISSELVPMLEEIEKIKSYEADNITFDEPTEDNDRVGETPGINMYIYIYMWVSVGVWMSLCLNIYRL